MIQKPFYGFMALLCVFAVSCQKSSFKGNNESPKPDQEAEQTSGSEPVIQPQNDVGSPGDLSTGSDTDNTLGNTANGSEVADTGNVDDLFDNMPDTGDVPDIDLGTNGDLGDTNLDFGSENDTSVPELATIPAEIIQNLDLPNVTPGSLNGPGGDTPLVLDLNGDHAVNTLAATKANFVFFDINGDARGELTEWIAPADGFLVMDRNGNGRIDSGVELFGDATPGRKPNGFLALAQLDDNGDGKITALDTSYRDLLVWQDRDANGVSHGSELTPISALLITEIDLRYVDTKIALPNSKSYIGQVSSFIRDGQKRSIVDVYFRGPARLVSVPKGEK